MRIILFTGKGGVGKTTMAAATALQSARAGHKTLVISTDPAHSLSDAFDVQLSPEPTLIEPNLYGQELDFYYSMKKYWSNVRELMLTVFRWQGVENVLAEEMSAIPGMEEASAFLWIEKYYSEKEFEVIVIDSAPTGETLTLLTLPQVTRWWVNKALPFQNFAFKTVGKAVRKTTGVPLDRGYEELQNLFDKLEKIQKIFSDPSICSIRIVANPERMVLNESKRAYTYLQLYGYNVDAVVVNRILPQFEGDNLFRQYLRTQAEYLLEIEEMFSHLPVMKIGHIGQEVFGLELLATIGQQLYGDQDPTRVMHMENPVQIRDTPGGYILRMKLPFIEASDYKLQKFGDELVLEIRNRRKNIFLPKFANFLELKSHSFESPWLTIHLAKTDKKIGG